MQASQIAVSSHQVLALWAAMTGSVPLPEVKFERRYSRGQMMPITAEDGTASFTTCTAFAKLQA